MLQTKTNLEMEMKALPSPTCGVGKYRIRLADLSYRRTVTEIHTDRWSEGQCRT